jgi:cysteine-rich repeat protein
MGLDPCVRLALAREAARSLVRLGQVRGTSVKTERRVARAAAVLVGAVGLVGSVPLVEVAHAATPRFRQFPFNLTNVGRDAKPTFVDIDGDGDLDAFVGEFYGNTIFFRNTGSSSAAAFAAASRHPFGLADVGIWSSPTFADIDGDGDLDAFIGNGSGNTIFFRNTGSSSAPAFAAASANPFGLASVGFLSSPAFADIDGDGDLDAFIGNGLGYTISFFENTGSSSAPAFAAASANPFGLLLWGFGSSPTFADIDGDGDLDAFIGNGFGYTISFFENTGSSSAPAFAFASANPFGLLLWGFGSSPTFADIDGDGDLDAFIGNSRGNTIFFENTGSSSAPAFAAASANPFGLYDVGWSSSPAFADIDGDGDLDAFIGNGYGDTIFFENTGSSNAPAFATPSTNPYGLTDVGFASSPTFADIDGDGDLDAFIGERNGNTFFFQNKGSSSAPAFAAASANPFGLADVGIWSSPAFADIDGDGDLDALIGNSDGDTMFFENISENIGCGNGGLDAGEECDDGNLDDSDGCNTLCQTPTGDMDNDGVMNAVENAGPNVGDGNSDGTPDSQQPHVASLPGARGGGAYQTMVTDPACPIRNLAAVALSPPGFNLPFGALAFELPGCESTRVTIYYHGVDSLSAPPMEYVKQGPNPPGASNNVVYTLSSGAPHTLTFGSANLEFDTAVGFASFTLSDNVVGDDTGDDGVIVDQGGPGFSTAAPVPVASGWGVLGSLLMLLGVGWRRLWRR